MSINNYLKERIELIDEQFFQEAENVKNNGGYFDREIERETLATSYKAPAVALVIGILFVLAGIAIGLAAGVHASLPVAMHKFMQMSITEASILAGGLVLIGGTCIALAASNMNRRRKLLDVKILQLRNRQLTYLRRAHHFECLFIDAAANTNTPKLDVENQYRKITTTKQINKSSNTDEHIFILNKDGKMKSTPGLTDSQAANMQKYLDACGYEELKADI